MHKQLEDGSLLEVQRSSGSGGEMAAYWLNERAVRILMGEHALLLTLRKRSLLASAAAYAGRELTPLDPLVSPFALHLVLAFIAAKHALPTRKQLELMSALAREGGAAIPRAGPVLPGQQVRAIVRDGFAAMRESIPLPSGLWNTARGLVAMGEMAWQLQGEQAAHWGSYPSDTTPSQPTWLQRMQLAALAGLTATPDVLQHLPLSPAAAATPEEVWVDYVSLAAGPGRPLTHLRPLGLGAFGQSPIENNADLRRLALSVEHGKALAEVAASLLQSVERPVPRYAGRVLSLDIPRHLLPQLEPWLIDTFLVQVEATGMYISVRDKSGRSMAAAWWRAATTSTERVPLSFTPASWVLLSPICASIWRDLCAEAITVHKPDLDTSGSGAAERSTPPKPRPEGKRKQSKIYLPPVRVERVEQVQWGSASDREAIRNAVTGWSGYRRLPTGWQDRRERADFQRRQQLAAQRAAFYGHPAPPTGFTYVQPPHMGQVTALSSETIPQVRAKGLFSLVLGLQSNAITPLEETELQEGG